MRAQLLAPASDGIDIKDLIAIFKRRRWVIASTVLLLTTLATLVGLQVTPTYTAKALIMIDPRETKVVDVEAVLQGMNADAATVETQLKVLKSRSHIARVMSELGLFSDPEFNVKLRESDRDLALRYSGPFERLVAWVPESWLIATGLAEEPLPPEALADEGVVAESAIVAFDQRFKAVQDGRSFVIALQFTSVDPQKASRIVNKAAELYVQDQLTAKLDATAEASGWLGERLESLRSELRMAEQAVEDYRVEHNLVDTNGGSLREQELSELNREVVIARGQLAEKQARLRLIRELNSRGESLDTIAEVLQSAVIVNLRQQEAMLLREEAELKTFYGARHPKMQNLVAEKANLKAKIAMEVERITKNLQNEVRILSSRVATMEQNLSQLTSQTERDRSVSVRLHELEREAQASRQLYEAFLQRFKETRDQQGIVKSDARVISQAAPPETPSSPGVKLFAAVGFTASLMLGSLLALLLERLDNGVRSGRQVEEHLGLAALGLVPRLERLKKGQKPHQYLIAKPLSAYAESLRAIYTGMQLSNVDNPP